MKLSKLLLFVLALSFFGIACNKTPLTPLATSENAQQATILTEGFETGTKTSYTTADVTLGTGVWNLNDALIGNTTSDRKVGTASARVRNSGSITMKFDATSGIGTVAFNMVNMERMRAVLGSYGTQQMEV